MIFFLHALNTQPPLIKMKLFNAATTKPNNEHKQDFV